MGLYSKEQLDYERSIGLQLSDAENEAYNNDGSRNESHFDSNFWTKEQFENYLSTKSWSEEIKNQHRKEFKGFISFSDYGTIFYEQ